MCFCLSLFKLISRCWLVLPRLHFGFLDVRALLFVSVALVIPVKRSGFLNFKPHGDNVGSTLNLVFEYQGCSSEQSTFPRIASQERKRFCTKPPLV